jgi:hypothetical protein
VGVFAFARGVLQVFNRNRKQIHQADGTLGGGTIQVH